MRTNRSAKDAKRIKEQRRRDIMVGFRLSRSEWDQVEAHRRKGELFSEAVRRILLDATAEPLDT